MKLVLMSSFAWDPSSLYCANEAITPTLINPEIPPIKKKIQNPTYYKQKLRYVKSEVQTTIRARPKTEKKYLKIIKLIIVIWTFIVFRAFI